MFWSEDLRNLGRSMFLIYSKNNLETSDTNPSLPRPVLLSCLFAITPPPIKILVLIRWGYAYANNFLDTWPSSPSFYQCQSTKTFFILPRWFIFSLWLSISSGSRWIILPKKLISLGLPVCYCWFFSSIEKHGTLDELWFLREFQTTSHNSNFIFIFSMLHAELMMWLEL